jgi:hypothetical protein
VTEKISHLHLTVVENLKRVFRDCLNDIHISARKMRTRITWGKIKVFEENGGKPADDF